MRPPTTETAPIGVTPAFARAEAAYLRLRDAANRVLPWLPSPYADRVRTWLSIADRALEAARLATSVADQLRELRRVEAATTELSAVAAQ